MRTRTTGTGWRRRVMPALARACPGIRLDTLPALLVTAALALGAGCLRIKSEPVEVKPIHITLDINVKVDRELDSFFNDLDVTAKKAPSAAVTGTPK